MRLQFDVAGGTVQTSGVRCITLTTDFGLADWFVGVMKGIIARVAPGARVIDLTHGLPVGDVAAGAFVLAAGCRWFPHGTIHVAVVDPGVGGPRAALVARTADYLFVGPDNGVLALALEGEQVREIRRIENRVWMNPQVSRTFHGRDVFAPVAARLARGASLRRVGARVADYVRLPWAQAARTRCGIRGTVVYIDRFGNALTTIPIATLGGAPAAWRVRVAARTGIPVAESYQAVPAGRPVAVPGSAGFLELAVNGGHAARRLRLRRGSAVELRRG